jgi:hypothetical protein
MKHIAEALAAKGRNGDSVLVHMSPAEVGGLQSLAKRSGTSLTINPHTGLPEAFSLGSILPMAAMLIPGLGPMASIALSAGLSGVGAMIDGRDPLSAAAMGGLTGGIGQGMSAVMAPAAQGATNAAMTEGSGLATAAADTMGNAMNFGAMNGVTPTLESAAALTNASAPAATAVPMAEQAAQAQAANSGIMGVGGPPPAWAGQAPDFNAATAAAPADTASGMYAPTATPETGLVPQMDLANSTGGVGVKDPSLLDKGVAWVKENPWKSAGIAGAGLLGLNALSGQDDAPEDPNSEWNYDPKQTGSTELTPEQVAYNQTTQGEKYYTNPNYGYYAGGGLLGLPGASSAKSKLAAKEPRPMARAPVRTPVKAPKFLQGKGDGMSDSINANIDGKEPVKLADSEYVVPADAVAHFGNGSSKAGAKHLDRVIKKIRRDKTGTTKQAPQVNPSNYLPI